MSRDRSCVALARTRAGKDESLLGDGKKLKFIRDSRNHGPRDQPAHERNGENGSSRC